MRLRRAAGAAERDRRVKRDLAHAGQGRIEPEVDGLSAANATRIRRAMRYAAPISRSRGAQTQQSQGHRSRGCALSHDADHVARIGADRADFTRALAKWTPVLRFSRPRDRDTALRGLTSRELRDSLAGDLQHRPPHGLRDAKFSPLRPAPRKRWARIISPGRRQLGLRR